MKQRIAFAGALAFTLTACASEPAPLPEPDDNVGHIVAKQLDPLGNVPVADDTLEYNLFQFDGATLDGDVTWDSCQAVRERIPTLCSELEGALPDQYCSGQATFFYANNVPRCAMRVQVFDRDARPLVPTYLVDFSGEPLAQTPMCGNGVIDANEECDDGNTDLWDGCDSNCIIEPFNGCEAVIEDYYKQSGIATVLASNWEGPRSHLMVNKHAVALREVNQQTCNAALGTAENVCRELEQSMPFVSWCYPEAAYHQDARGGACSLRLNVYFSRLDPGFGVYSTSLQGVLAFTIRE